MLLGYSGCQGRADQEIDLWKGPQQRCLWGNGRISTLEQFPSRTSSQTLNAGEETPNLNSNENAAAQISVEKGGGGGRNAVQFYKLSL